MATRQIKTSIPGTIIGATVPLRLAAGETVDIADVTLTGSTGITISTSPDKAMNSSSVTIKNFTYLPSTCVVFGFAATQAGTITIAYTGSLGTDQELSVEVVEDVNPPDVAQRLVLATSIGSNPLIDAFGFVSGSGQSSATRQANNQAWRNWLASKGQAPQKSTLDFPPGVFEFEGALDLVGNGLTAEAESWAIRGSKSEDKGQISTFDVNGVHHGTKFKIFLSNDTDVWCYIPGSTTTSQQPGGIEISDVEIEIATVGSVFTFGDPAQCVVNSEPLIRGIRFTNVEIRAPNEAATWATTPASEGTVLQTARNNWAIKCTNCYDTHIFDCNFNGFAGPQVWMRRCDAPKLRDNRHYAAMIGCMVHPGVSRSKLGGGNTDGVPGVIGSSFAEGSILASFVFGAGEVEFNSENYDHANYTPSVDIKTLPSSIAWAIHGMRVLPTITAAGDDSGSLSLTFSSAHTLKVGDVVHVVGTGTLQIDAPHTVSTVTSSTVVKTSTGYASSFSGTAYGSTPNCPNVTSIGNSSGKTLLTFSADHKLSISQRVAITGSGVSAYNTTHLITSVPSSTTVVTNQTYTSTSTGTFTATHLPDCFVRLSSLPSGKTAANYFRAGMLMRIAAQTGAQTEEPEHNLIVEEVDSTNNLVFFGAYDGSCHIPRVVPYDGSGAGNEISQVFGVGANLVGERLAIKSYRAGFNTSRPNIPEVAIAPEGEKIYVGGRYVGRTTLATDMTQKLLVCGTTCGKPGAHNGRVVLVGQSAIPHPLIDQAEYDAGIYDGGGRAAQDLRREALGADIILKPGRGFSNLADDLGRKSFAGFTDSVYGYAVYGYNLWHQQWRVALESYPNVLYVARVYSAAGDGSNVYKKFEVYDGVTQHQHPVSTGWNTIRGITGSGATQFSMSRRAVWVAWVAITFPRAYGRRLPNSWKYGTSATEGTSASGAPTTTNFPADGDEGFYEDTAGPTRYWCRNYSGTIRKVAIA